MRGLKLVYLPFLVLCFILTGCVVRTYEATKDRLDQEVTGNRGYLKGTAPETQEPVARKTTRNVRIVEVELYPPVRFEKGPKPETIKSEPVMKEGVEDREVIGNRGYITRSVSPEIEESAGYTLQKYTVQKNDTLQKISKKFYGTTKKWTKIYDANRDILKGPNKIYPGQTINIPVVESKLKEPPENLK